MKLTWQEVEERAARANSISVWPSASLFQDSKVGDDSPGNGKFPDISMTFCGTPTRVPTVRESQGILSESEKVRENEFCKVVGTLCYPSCG